MVRESSLTAAMAIAIAYGTGCHETPGVLHDATVTDTAGDRAVVDAVEAGGNDVTDEEVPRPPARELLSLSAGGSRVVLSGTPLAIEVRGPDGGRRVGSTEAWPLIQFGVRPDGPSPTRFHDPRVEVSGDITWVSPLDVVSVDGAAGRVTLRGPHAGEVTLVLASPEPGHFTLGVTAAGPEVAMIRVNLGSDDGGYHGLGEQFASTDHRGRVVPMQLQLGSLDSGTNEQHAPVPFLVSTKGYGMFVESREAGAFDVASRHAERVSATFEGAGATVHFYVGDPTEVIAAYTRTTGLPRMPPEWAFGPMQWRNEWTSSDQMLADARRLRSEGLATTTIWIDNPWLRSYVDNEIDRVRFHDPEGLLRSLQAMGYRVLFWSVPYLDAVRAGAQPQNEAERRWVMARDRGWLMMRESTTPPSPYVTVFRYAARAGMNDAYGSLVDFTSEAATNYWADALQGLIGMGARAFKLDFGEDVVPEIAGMRPRYRFSDGSTERTTRWFYPQGYHRAYRLALDRYAGGDGFLLGRQSSWGGQSVLDIVWPGDLDNDFSEQVGTTVGGLPAAVCGMISLAESGFPSFASDTGGYRGGMPTREALLRWSEQTALSPFMQLGGGGASHNPWEYDPEAVTIYRGLARLHQDLAPYYIANAQRAARDGTPPVRSVALAFPSDLAAREDRYAYVLGESLLVAPVVTAGAVERRVHLPAGEWVHWWSGRHFDGPTNVTVPTPLGQPAFFARAGAVIPMFPQELDTMSTATETDVVDRGDRATVARMVVFATTGDTLGQIGETHVTVTQNSDGFRVRWSPGLVSGVMTDTLRLELDRGALPGTFDSADLTQNPLAGTGGCVDCITADTARVKLTLRARRDVTVTLHRP